MIISASRRCDIPAFHSEWFFKRIQEGVLQVRNVRPEHCHVVKEYHFTPKDIDCIVFWTKAPSDYFIENLKILDELKIPWYIQHTITGYHKNVEPGVSYIGKEKIIENFKKIHQMYGPGHLVWRYDPISMITEFSIQDNIAIHLKYFHEIAEQLQGYANRCVFSFIDTQYRKEALAEWHIRELTETEMPLMAEALKLVADDYGFTLESCAEKVDLSSLGIKHTACIDGALIEQIAGKQFDFKKDAGQRALCRCVKSLDVGNYFNCWFDCVYCYARPFNATYDPKKSRKFIGKEQSKPDGLIIGNDRVKELDDVEVIQLKPMALKQPSLF